tara:strand:+ start:702 stop:1070 length:369 start_codon:yes stop_codon:yes gene_type:complete
MKDFITIFAVQMALVALISLFAVSDFASAGQKADGWAMNAGNQYAVLFPPGTQSHDAISKVIAAGGSVVRFGAFDNLVIVNSSAFDFKKTQAEYGAIFVFTPFIKGNCLILDKSRFQVSEPV